MGRRFKAGWVRPYRVVDLSSGQGSVVNPASPELAASIFMKDAGKIDEFIDHGRDLYSAVIGSNKTALSIDPVDASMVSQFREDRGKDDTEEIMKTDQ